MLVSEQPLKFAYYEHFIATPPMRHSRRGASLANRILVILIIVTITSVVLLWKSSTNQEVVRKRIIVPHENIKIHRRGNLSFTQADRACIQDEWDGSSTARNTEVNNDTFRISFSNVQKNFRWLHQPKLAENAEILMIVVSRCDNFARRNTLRQTWMSAAKSRMVAEGRMKALFLVGMRPGHEKINRIVMEEAKMFGDVIVTDVVEDYLELPFKSLSLFLYALFKSPSTQLIGKIDEDVLFYPDQLYPLLERDIIRFNVSAVYGNLYSPGVRVNHSGGKWAVPKTSFKCTAYPAYLSGPIYFSTRKAALRIVNASKHRKLISVEDVLITGLLAGDVGVEKQHLPNIYSVESDTKDREKSQILAWHTKKKDSKYEKAFEEHRLTRCASCLKPF